MISLVSDGGLVDWGRGVVDGGWDSMVDRGRLVSHWLVSWGRLVSGGLRVVSFTGVGNIGNVSTVTISNVVGHSLKTAVRKSYGVASLGRISITRLIGIVVGSTVVVIDSVLVAVHGWLIIRGLMIRAIHRGGHGATGGSGDTGENDESLHVDGLLF